MIPDYPLYGISGIMWGGDLTVNLSTAPLGAYDVTVITNRYMEAQCSVVAPPAKKPKRSDIIEMAQWEDPIEVSAAGTSDIGAYNFSIVFIGDTMIGYSICSIY